MSLESFSEQILSNLLIGFRYLDEEGHPQIKTQAVTNLIEHPIQMKPPSE